MITFLFVSSNNKNKHTIAIARESNKNIVRSSLILIAILEMYWLETFVEIESFYEYCG